MNMIARVATWSMLLGLTAGLAAGQSLAELSKKEKSRREKLKGRTALVVTNEDLKSLRKREVLQIRAAGAPPLEEVLPSEERGGAGTETLDESLPPAQVDQSMPFAWSILPSTSLVADAGSAIGGPDGAAALIAYGGYLDVEIDVKNGEGQDLAVYAQRPEEGILPETMLYFVFVPDESGEWTNIGTGTGASGREDFDLGELKSVSRVRILFWEVALYDGVKPLRVYPGEYAMGVDAVEALHR